MNQPGNVNLGVDMGWPTSSTAPLDTSTDSEGSPRVLEVDTEGLDSSAISADESKYPGHCMSCWEVLPSIVSHVPSCRIPVCIMCERLMHRPGNMNLGVDMDSSSIAPNLESYGHEYTSHYTTCDGCFELAVCLQQMAADDD